ncbi:MAG: hypothetical protein AAGN66_05505 [Acidobacteriota bacterium]
MNRKALTSGKILCEVVNPSDPYSLRCDDFLVGCVAVLFLGEGAYGCHEVGGEERQSPVLMGWEAFLEANGIEIGPFADQRASEIADALDSLLIGSPALRLDVESMAAEIPDSGLDSWLDGYLDRHRSSMNNIGGYARHLSERFRSTEGPKT